MMEGREGLGGGGRTTASGKRLKRDRWPETETEALGQEGLEPGPQAASPGVAPGLGSRSSSATPQPRAWGPDPLSLGLCLLSGWSGAEGTILRWWE